MNIRTEAFRVFITRPIPDIVATNLKQYANIKVWEGVSSPSREELIESSKDCHGLLAMLSDPIDRDFIDACPKLKVIANYAVGYNNIDWQYAQGKGIWVSNTPDVLTEATADLALALLLAVSRRIVSSHKSVEAGSWHGWEPLGFLGPSLTNKTLGIVGMGRIGECFAKKCQAAFGMKILYNSRSPKPQAEEKLGAQYMPLDEMLPQCDVVSLHCPLNDDNRGLFNRERFEGMKKGAIFINTGRGELHNEEDLLSVIENGHLDGAGLDVTNPEPMNSGSPLLKCPNVVVSPHIGSATFEARDAMAALAAQNILAALTGKPLPSPVNQI